MAVDRTAVAHIAQLARIRVDEAHGERLSQELSNILGWVEQLNELDTEGVEPMTSVVEVRLPMREDVIADGEQADEVLANAPETAGGYFVVPKVLE